MKIDVKKLLVQIIQIGGPILIEAAAKKLGGKSAPTPDTAATNLATRLAAVEGAITAHRDALDYQGSVLTAIQQA